MTLNDVRAVIISPNSVALWVSYITEVEVRPILSAHSAPGGLSVVENPFRYGLNTYKRLLTYFIRLLNV